MANGGEFVLALGTSLVFRSLHMAVALVKKRNQSNKTDNSSQFVVLCCLRLFAFLSLIQTSH